MLNDEVKPVIVGGGYLTILTHKFIIPTSVTESTRFGKVDYLVKGKVYHMGELLEYMEVKTFWQSQLQSTENVKKMMDSFGFST